LLKDYSIEVQRVFLEMMLQDAESFVRVQNIYNPENFDRSLREAAEFIQEHSDKHKTLPNPAQITAATGVRLDAIPDLNSGHFEWFMTEFEGFTRKQELERAILKSADLLEKGDFGPVEKLIKDAVQISLQKDLGTDYFDDPRARLMRLKDGNGQQSTGWPSLDKLLYGGFSRGELNIFAGGSGSGKSLFMMNLAVNWVEAGLHGVYLSLELYESMSAKRIDSMITEVAATDIFKQIDEVEMKVKMKQKTTHGGLQIKYMPAQSNVNDIRAYIKELQIKTGRKIDFLCVDYLDLLMPVSAKVSPNDLFVKDKYVSEELRTLAGELQVLFVTASQLNRAAVEEIEFDHSHISGGISKINTADNVFGIFTSRALKERGRYNLQLMKTRSSSGVGQKVELGYSIETMRITDLGEDAPPVNSFRKNTVLDSIKTRSEVSEQEDAPKITAEVNSNKLKALLGQIKQG
jgi:archaellum biogenesis ATPase FlaH